jgi:PAS domain S-box-containing protein
MHRTVATGALRSFLGHYSQLRDDEGKVIGIVSVDVDVTDAKKAEEELKAGQRLLSTIFENIPLGICVKDLAGRYRMVNKSFAAYVNHAPAEMIGKVSSEIGHGTREEQRRVEETDRIVLETGKPFERPEEVFTFPNGEQRLRRILKVPLKDAAGVVSGILGIREDITERKQIEEQLRHSQKMEAIGTLAGGIAHDLNNILSPIIGYSELLVEAAAGNSDEKRSLGMILSAAHRAKDLVSQILVFSRRMESEKKVFDPRPIARDVMKLIRSTVPSNIRIQESFSDDAGLIAGDPSQIHQVLLNLCINAGQAMPNGGTLEVKTEKVKLAGAKALFGKELHGAYLRLEVADTGEGMDEETLSHIFDPFFTTKDVGTGTGLGLSTVFGTVQAHDGGLRVSSRLGKGTTFEVFLPTARGGEKPVEPLEESRATGTEAILVIDDEEGVREVTKNVLERNGYRVTAFSDGVEALERFRANPESFQLIIMDQTMPNATGEWVLNTVRGVRPDVPVVLCTGYSETMTPERAKALGANRFLYKPIKAGDLARIVRDVLDERK